MKKITALFVLGIALCGCTGSGKVGVRGGEGAKSMATSSTAQGGEAFEISDDDVVLLKQKGLISASDEENLRK